MVRIYSQQSSLNKLYFYLFSLSTYLVTLSQVFRWIGVEASWIQSKHLEFSGSSIPCMKAGEDLRIKA